MDNFVYSEWVELRWAVMGDRLKSDHNYRLYSSMVRTNPSLKEIDWQLNTIQGIPDHNGWVKLGRDSYLMVRCRYADLKAFEVFDNALIRLGQNIVQLGDSEGRAIAPKESLSSRLVTIKSAYVCRVSPFEFGVVVGKQMQQLGISTLPVLGDRKALTIKDDSVVGYALSFSALRPEESMALQICGLGGRRKIGCGVFV